MKNGGIRNPAQAPAVSVILPIVSETDSLRRTVDVLEEQVGDRVQEYLFAAARHAGPGTLATAEELCRRLGDKGILFRQKDPGVGAAVREAFELARMPYVVLMNSDLETDPSAVADMIRAADEKGLDVVTASRWLVPGSFHGYGPVKLILNWAGQKILALLYGVDLSDMTFGFRLLRRDLIRSIRWEEAHHPFFLETIVKPLRLGVRVGEVSCEWRARREGFSSNTFFRNFQYLRTGLRVRFQPLDTIKRRRSNE